MNKSVEKIKKCISSSTSYDHIHSCNEMINIAIKNNLINYAESELLSEYNENKSIDIYEKNCITLIIDFYKKNK